MSGGQGGATAFAFGKHRGRTFDEVRRQDPRYVQWARKEARTGALGDFVAYCDAAEGRPPHGAPAAARPPLGGPAAAGRPSAGGAPDGRSPPQKRGIDGGTDQAGASPSPKRRLSTASTAASSPTAGAAAAGDGPRTCEKCDSENLPFPGAFRCGPCWREHFQSVDEPFFLRCPVTEKDEAKRRGAWWHPEMKKWYVPAGRDISLLERWFVRCARCGEGLSDHPRMRYNPGSQADPPACRPECASDRLQREEAELEERERQEVAEMQQQQKEEAERRREAMKKRIKADYLSSLRAEARAIQDMIAAKNERIAAEDGSAGVPLQIPAGGLVEYVNQKLVIMVPGSAELYNPFHEGDKCILPLSASRWLRSFGSKKFIESTDYIKCIDYHPITRILDWACTFHNCFLDDWIDEAGLADPRLYVRSQLKLLPDLLLQALDPVTPDLKFVIQDTLRTRYSTTCPDIVGIFGQNILPAIRQSIGDAAFMAMNRRQKADWCVLEYMQHRKTYDRACKETEATTYMRDVLNYMIETMMSEDAKTPGPMLSSSSNDDLTDIIYYARAEARGAPATAGTRCFMLKNPNTAAADLFSAEVVEKAISAMRGNSLQVPTPAELRQRIFAVYRTLYARITRKAASDGFARYGLDAGLREADQEKGMLKVKKEHHGIHTEMLRYNWIVRDYVGFENRRLHSNSDLLSILFTDHLQLDPKAVAKVEKASRKHISRMRKEEDTKNKELRKGLEKAGVPVRALVDM